MKPTQELIDQIYREKVLRARQMPLEDKLLAGPRLFDMACEFARAGIRHQFPDATSEEVDRELQRRLRIQRILESQ
ncbi:MAG: hypothetical protein ACJ8C4_10185 [Gemmataceae bacterium]